MQTIRVAFAGHDFFSSCLKLLVQRPDTQVLACLSDGPSGQPADHVAQLAQEADAPLLLGRWSEERIAALNEMDLDLLVCAAYKYKIPVEKLRIPWMVNLHPTLLPEGRGPDPVPYLVHEKSQYSGISIHQMTETMDEGPLLVQEAVPLEPSDGFNEVYLKLYAAAPRVLESLLQDVGAHFEAARAQSGGSYWPEPPAQRHQIDATSASVNDVRYAAAEFGIFGIQVHLADGTSLHSSVVHAAPCSHGYTPGEVVARMKRGTVVAVRDGLVWVRPEV